MGTREGASVLTSDGRRQDWKISGSHFAGWEIYHVNVLRDAMAIDSMDPCGVYIGTSGGQVYASANAGDSWSTIVRALPAVLSVEIQTLP